MMLGGDDDDYDVKRVLWIEAFRVLYYVNYSTYVLQHAFRQW